MPTCPLALRRKHKQRHSEATLLRGAPQEAKLYLLRKETSPAVPSPPAPAVHQLPHTEPALGGGSILCPYQTYTAIDILIDK